mmetsp:Transcript_125719/g.217990  ORF Transcript_125719/g.217990 Transcript_125719/m.217990 type:complete len:138 (-) Transcript_125719:395-808(-)
MEMPRSCTEIPCGSLASVTFQCPHPATPFHGVSLPTGSFTSLTNNVSSQLQPNQEIISHQEDAIHGGAGSGQPTKITLLAVPPTVEIPHTTKSICSRPHMPPTEGWYHMDAPADLHKQKLAFFFLNCSSGLRQMSQC